MKKVRKGGLFLWVAVVLVGIGAGIAVGARQLYGWGRSLAVSSVPGMGSGRPTALEQDPDVEAALRYARAVQDGFCDGVIRSTAWMADRLHRVAIESSGQEAVDQEWDALCAKIQDRAVEGNLLLPEGIEDQYLFAPGAIFEVERVDSGRNDLDRPVAKRVWIRVTLPRRQTAPLARSDEVDQMLAIRAVTVGVNISKGDRLVVKAGVIGNLDIDTATLSFNWTSGGGG